MEEEVGGGPEWEGTGGETGEHEYLIDDRFTKVLIKENIYPSLLFQRIKG